jgi:hypothetical protein
LKDVVKFIEKASKGTSPLPALLKEARTDEATYDVIQIVSEDKKMAKLLAQALLAAKTETDAANAFAGILEAAAISGTDDPEVIMLAKLDALVAKYVMQGELAMSKIKDRFNTQADAATNNQELDAAQNTAGQAALDKNAEIEQALSAAVEQMAPGYDLSDARARISTALAAGRAEVRLNHARQSSRLQARDFAQQLNNGLAEANSSADIEELLAGAKEYAAEAQAGLAGNLREILDEAAQDPGLVSRIAEAEAYAEAIKAEQAVAFEDANAGAELAGTGAQARSTIKVIRERLEAGLAEATTQEEVDELLSTAEADANALTARMNDRLNTVIEEHGLGETAGGSKQGPKKLAADMRKSVAKDIEAIAGRAVALADKRKAGLEKEAANAANALFEATQQRATAAGAEMAKLASNLRYW